MDTGTHFVMGIGLFGLAHLDPVLFANPDTVQAILIGTVVGSQIPDIDTLYRLRGTPDYIRNHRGWSHSLPMLLIWPTLLTVLLLFLFPTANWHHLWLWTWVGVFIHVFIDLFNTYGTQAFRPLSPRWVSWNIINIFDPFIFTTHLIGFSLWLVLRLHPGWVMVGVYLVLIAYLLWRTWVHHQLVEWVKEHSNMKGKYTVTPTGRWDVWNVIVEQTDLVKVGEIRKKRFYWTGQISTHHLHHPAVIKSKETDAVAAFLSFTSYGYPEVLPRDHGYEVRWLDVRYHHKKHFPFVAVALLDHDYKPFHSFVGWMSEDQLEKRVDHLLS